MSLSTSSAAEGRNDLSKRGTQGLCYQRTYNAGHLRRRPSQTITSATVLLRPSRDKEAPDDVDLSARLTMRDGPEPLYGMAS
jgi:hypothetical protein